MHRFKSQIINLSIKPMLLSFIMLGVTPNVMAESIVEDDIPAVDCVINPYKIVDITSAVPGVLDVINVERSDWIKKGHVIASLESGVERATVALAKVRAEIESEIKLKEVNLLFDRKNQIRINQLHDRQAVSSNAKEQAARDVELSTWELQQAKDLKKVRVIELQRAREQLKQKTIRAPFDGFIVQKFKSGGEYVEDQPIVRIAQFDPLLIEAIVPMELFGKIDIGMEGMVYPELYEDQPKKARVVAVDRMGDAASRTFGVRLELPNSEFTIPAGLKCEIKFNSPGVISEN